MLGKEKTPVHLAVPATRSITRSSLPVLGRLGLPKISACSLRQVESPSPELGWLVCLALTGGSRDAADGGGGEVRTAAEAAAAAGLLDEEAFFQHFFGRLAGESFDGVGREGGDADGLDARVLAQVSGSRARRLSSHCCLRRFRPVCRLEKRCIDSVLCGRELEPPPGAGAIQGPGSIFFLYFSSR